MVFAWTDLAGSLFIAVGYALFLFFLSFYTKILRKWDSLIINYTAGLMFCYLFMTLLPDIYLHAETESVELLAIAFFMFVGYIGFYLAEKKVFESTKVKREFSKKLFAIRQSGFYILHYVTGFIIVFTFAEKTLQVALLLLIPFTFHIVTTSFLYEDVHKWVEGTLEARIMFPVLIIVGAISAVVTNVVLGIDLIYFYSFFAGTFIYLVMSILTPEHKHGTLTSFLFGILSYMVLLIIQSSVM